MKVVALAGGVGGAKLAEGLAQILPSRDLTIIVNTGDDFEHFGLYICPDLDTVCYTLAGRSNPGTGWGLAQETWRAMQSVSSLGGPTGFKLGDCDLGTHLECTRRLRSGDPLSLITRDFSRAWGIGPSIIPMSDDRVATVVDTQNEGKLPFQEYFVQRQCKPVVTGFQFLGIDTSRPAPGVIDAIHGTDLVVFCPSNPWVSIDPILSVPGLRDAVRQRPVIAVSPIIAGRTVKGPAAKMFAELGFTPSVIEVARHYQNLLRGLVIDEVDRDLAQVIRQSGIEPLITQTVMKTDDDRRRLAGELLEFSFNLDRRISTS